MTSHAQGANPLLASGLFVGREEQVSRLARLLHQGRSSLLVGGRRVGKTTLVHRLSSDNIGRTVVFTDAAGWDMTSESAGLGGMLSALEGGPATRYDHASRSQVVKLLEATRPLAVIIDEADRLLQTSWGPGFFSFLRWLDDTHMRGDLSLLLTGGPVLTMFKDPDDRGSPPLNTAEPMFIDPLENRAILELAELAGKAADHDHLIRLGGGHAWLTTRLLAELWEGSTLDDAADIVFDRAIGTFHVWERQLGDTGRDLLRMIPPDGVLRSSFRSKPWSRYREAAMLCRCVGALRHDGDRIFVGPQLFADWFAARNPEELTWDVAISYASEDEALARQLNSQLRTEFKIFFAPEEAASLWGTDLHRVLPNTYGVQSKYVLVLSTQQYVAKYWTRVEYESVASSKPDRILLLDLGALPTDLPHGLVYRGGSPAELVGLISALHSKLGNTATASSDAHRNA